MAIFHLLVGVPTKNQCATRSRDDFGLFPNNRKHGARESKPHTGSGERPGQGGGRGAGHTDRQSHWVSVGSVLVLQLRSALAGRRNYKRKG